MELGFIQMVAKTGSVPFNFILIPLLLSPHFLFIYNSSYVTITGRERGAISSWMQEHLKHKKTYNAKLKEREMRALLFMLMHEWSR